MFARLSIDLNQLFWRNVYQFLARLDREGDWSFMNYGFADLGPGSITLPLEPADEKDRFCIQLYHHVAETVDLKGLDVLEIGCGRGGGCSYIMRYLQPRSTTGVDLSERAVGLCRRHHVLPGLSFFHGDAESLPFSDHKFDAVINVESSHCYASMERFLSEVYRVLRPDGHFLFADFRLKDRVALLHENLQRSRLQVVKSETITAGVVDALDRDTEHKETLIRQKAPWYVRRWIRNWAGLKGSKIYEAFRQGYFEYHCFVLRKNVGSH